MAVIRGAVIAFVSFVVSLVVSLVFLLPAYGLVSSGPIIAINNQGRPLTGGTVTIVNTATSLDVTADMFANAAGTTAFSATVPQSGIVQFFGAAGAYQVTISSQGVTNVYYIDIPSAATGVEDDDFPSTNLPGHLIATSSGMYSALKHNLNASVAPTSGDDSGDNYSVGSLWIDTTGDAVYTCVDATVANAVWVQGAGSTVTTGSSLGTGADVYKQLSGTTLQFRSIVAGDGVTVDENANDVTITGPTFAISTSGSTISWQAIVGNAVTLRIPDAGTTIQRGVVTNGTQSFAGLKTFAGDTTFSNDITVDENLTVTEDATFGNDSFSTVLLYGDLVVTDLAAFNNDVTLGSGGTDNIQSLGAFITRGSTTLGDATGDVVTVTGTATFAEVVTASAGIDITGELSITGVSGSGKAVCVKVDGDLGVCSDAVGGGGTCTCG